MSLHRTHYSPGWEHTYPEPAMEAETMLCGAEDTGNWTGIEDYTTCPDCLLLLQLGPDDPPQPGDGAAARRGYGMACHFRRLEIDAWLKQEGAVVIRVEDLGAALAFLPAMPSTVFRPASEICSALALSEHRLARRALGLGEGS